MNACNNKMVYKIKFKHVDKDVLSQLTRKSRKSFRSRKGHSLYFAEQLLKNAKDELEIEEALNLNLHMILEDSFEKVTYDFEEVTLAIDDSYTMSEWLKRKLISEMETEDENKINDLIVSIEEEYQKEVSNYLSGDEKSDQEQGKKLDQEIYVPEKLDFSIFEEPSYLERKEEKPNAEPGRKYKEEIKEELPSPEIVLSQPPQPVKATETFVIPENDEKLKDSPIGQPGIIMTQIKEEITGKSKEKEISFPDYNSYIDLSQLDSLINRTKEQYTPDQLIKCLYLNPELAYAKEAHAYAETMLQTSEYVKLQQTYQAEVAELLERAQTTLIQLYDKTMQFHFEDTAKAEIQEELISLQKNKELLLSQKIVEMNKEAKNAIESFEAEQEQALLLFRQQQEKEKIAYINRLQEKKEEQIKYDRQKDGEELKQQEEQLLISKIVELKEASLDNLHEIKRQAVRRTGKELYELADDMKDLTDRKLEELKQKIEEKIPKWQEDFLKKEAELEKRKEHQRTEELHRKNIEVKEMEKRKLETEAKHCIQQEKQLQQMQQEIQEQHQKQDSKFESIMTAFMEHERKVYDKMEEDKKKRRSLFAGIGIGLGIMLALGAVTFTITSYAKEPAISVRAEEKEGINESVQTEGEEVVAKEIDSLDTLLSQKRYMEAMIRYQDPNSLEKIEDALYQAEDYELLCYFNKQYQTSLGELDQAILASDPESVKAIYEKMSDAARQKLPENRVSKVVQLITERPVTDLG